jgi:hypothetical protein
VLLPRELDHLQRLRDARRDLCACDTAHPEPESDVAVDAHVREQRVVLENHAEAAALGRQRVDAEIVQHDRPVGQGQQPGDAIERRRFAATRRTEQCDELATLDRHGQRGQRVERGAALAGEAARHAIEPQLTEIMFHGLTTIGGSSRTETPR